MILGVAIQYAYADPPAGCDPPTYCAVITATSSKIGIGTTTPASALHVWGDIRIGSSSAGIVFPDGSVQKVAASAGGAVSAANVSTDVFGRFQGNGNFAAPASFGVATSSQNGLPQPLSVYGNAYISGSVGIGTTSPGAPLTIQNNNYLGLRIQATGASDSYDIYRDAGTGFLSFKGVQATYSGFSFTTDLGEKLTILNNGNVGIGTTTPAYKLDVVGSARITSKLTVTTIDPEYTIDGKTYVTYVPSIAGGVKEETAGIAKLEIRNSKLEIGAAEYAYVIDFNNVERGSDLWLFGKVTDFGPRMEYLVVQLTPSLNQRVWYEKMPGENKLLFYGEKGGEVSYRLIANRQDWRDWPTEVKGK